MDEKIWGTTKSWGTREQQAMELAAKAHLGQAYGDQNFVYHLAQTVAVLCEYGYSDEDTVIGGVLHDLLEDCSPIYVPELANFGFTVLRIVAFCTDERGANRKERKAKTYQRNRELIDSDSDGPLYWRRAIRVKLADRLANLRQCKKSEGESSLLKMYCKERDAFREALYIPWICDAMWAEYDALLENEEG